MYFRSATPANCSVAPNHSISWQCADVNTTAFSTGVLTTVPEGSEWGRGASFSTSTYRCSTAPSFQGLSIVTTVQLS